MGQRIDVAPGSFVMSGAGWMLSADGCPVCDDGPATFTLYTDAGEIIRVHEKCGAAMPLLSETSDFG